jgi:hypothetical protein
VCGVIESIRRSEYGGGQARCSRAAGGMCRAFSPQILGDWIVRLYQPIAPRWAHNLVPYQASELQRMVKYFEEASPRSWVMLAKAEASR